MNIEQAPILPNPAHNYSIYLFIFLSHPKLSVVDGFFVGLFCLNVRRVAIL